jgi:hypothetical protein
MWQSSGPEMDFLFESIPETHLNAEIASPSLVSKDNIINVIPICFYRGSTTPSLGS